MTLSELFLLLLYLAVGLLAVAWMSAMIGSLLYIMWWGLGFISKLDKPIWNPEESTRIVRLLSDPATAKERKRLGIAVSVFVSLFAITFLFTLFTTHR